ncbi:hypothetical protein ACPZ19_51320 [Amycolatopsis lurida]
MSELKDFVVLQARLYAFLAQQDDVTLQAIANGTARLAVVRTDDAGSETPEGTPDASRLTTASVAMAPPRDPRQVARDLPMLASERERQLYLNAAGLRVKELREVAKLLGLVRYSFLNRAKLIELLAGYGTSPSDAHAEEPRDRAASRPAPVEDTSVVEQQQASTEEAPPSPTPNPRVATIASHLREIETEEEGISYLHAQHLTREDLLAVAAELQLTRVERLKQAELEKRVIKQAIGARRKFAGLRTW